MAKLLHVNSFKDSRGILSVIQDEIDFKIKRVYYVYKSNGLRGGHKHKEAKQALICLNGACTVLIKSMTKDGIVVSELYELDQPDMCLILEPEDWHTFELKKRDSILLVLASNLYNTDDYITDL